MSDITLENLLADHLADSGRPLLSEAVIPSILKAIGRVGEALRPAHHVGQVGSANAFGDDQLNVDILAEDIIREEAAVCPAIVTASSEEDPVEKSIPHGDSSTTDETKETYTIAFDPLDGSSIIAPNWTVGTIVGIWDGPTALNQDPLVHQVAAVIGVLGPRTSAIIALRRQDSSAVTFEIGINHKQDKVDFEVVNASTELLGPPFKTRYFAPANLRSAAEDEKYLKLINHFIQDKYTLRYCGGLVPDIFHILNKRQGLYVSPVTGSSKAKLRRLYELLPMALVIEGAKGLALEPETGNRIISRAVKDIDERGGLLCGTAEEVELVKKFLLP